MSNKKLQWTDAAQVVVVQLESERLFMFRSAVANGRSFFHEYAYFLVRSGGNCLFNGPDAARFYHRHRAFFDAYGGIALQVCTHAGDYSDATVLLEELWGTRTVLSRWDTPQIAERAGRTLEGFAENAGLGPDIGAIHTPGHTLGFHCFRWSGSQGHYLFASHALLPRARGWRFALHPLMRDAALRSLEKIRALDVDFLLPNALRGNGTAPPVPHAFGKSERGQAVNQAIAEIGRKLRAPKRKGTKVS
jgi:glyoxylase-like metal-dependent hydrolase (beta-lactamase superfamily II)